jgi:hypothetical protein
MTHGRIVGLDRSGAMIAVAFVLDYQRLNIDARRSRR